MDNPIDLLDSVEKYLLLLLYSRGGEPIKGDTWLQKEMFLIGNNVDEIGGKYGGYLKGPYSEAVDKSISQFERSDYVRKAPSRGIELTKKGSDLAKQVWEATGEEDRKMVESIKELLNDMTHDELLAYIYASYPKTTENSDIKDDVESKRLQAAISLIRREKISVEKGAEIAGLSLKNFIKELRSKKIPIFELID